MLQLAQYREVLGTIQSISHQSTLMRMKRERCGVAADANGAASASDDDSEEEEEVEEVEDAEGVDEE